MLKVVLPVGKSHRFNRNDQVIIEALMGEEEMTSSELGDLTGFKLNHLSKRIDVLEDLGVVSRKKPNGKYGKSIISLNKGVLHE